MNHSNIDKYNAFEGIPAMTSEQIHKYLEELGSKWTGQGVAMELGCWLGASARALLYGLFQANYNKTFWAFDAWVANKDQIPKAAAQGVCLAVGQDTLPLFMDNIEVCPCPVDAIKGTLPATLKYYNREPIEICLFDAPKTDPTFTDCINALSPYWIEGVTVLGLLDYDFYLRHKGQKREAFRAPVRFMEKFGNHFVVEKEWEDEAVKFFRYVRKFN
jgi:hypothetical protein